MTNRSFFERKEPLGAPPQREPNPRQRILVVDDEALVRQVNVEVLIYSGYHVDSAGDGATAWETLQQNNYDLVITDNNMPRLTGVELIQKIHAARLALPVIMATGAMPDEEFTRHHLPPPAGILLKPYTFDELLATVKAVLRAASESLGEMAPPPNWPVQLPVIVFGSEFRPAR